jgi:hypothetical protein
VVDRRETILGVSKQRSITLWSCGIRPQLVALSESLKRKSRSRARFDPIESEGFPFVPRWVNLSGEASVRQRRPVAAQPRTTAKRTKPCLRPKRTSCCYLSCAGWSRKQHHGPTDLSRPNHSGIPACHTIKASHQRRIQCRFTSRQCSQKAQRTFLQRRRCGWRRRSAPTETGSLCLKRRQSSAPIS